MSDIADKSGRTLRILIIEDSTRDAELIAASIRRSGQPFQFEIIDLPEVFQQRLAEAEFDLILSDHNLRTWTGLDALEMLRRSGKDIPFIVVTGFLGDERAVEYLKGGANDYVLKERLERLPLAIARTLREKNQRDENTRLQKEIRESKEDWEKTFDAISDSIIILDRDSRIVRSNKSTEIFLGLNNSQIIGRTCCSLIHSTKGRPLACPFQRAMKTGKEEEAEMTDNVSAKTVRVSVIPLRSREGEFEGGIHIMRDITESKQLQEELLQAQKLEAIGRLAGGVAHDFNNNLAVILGYSQLLEKKIPQAEGLLRDHVKQIEDASNRAARVTRQLLAFSRKQILQPLVISLNDLVTEMAAMLSSLIGENIELIVTKAEDLGSVKIDPGQFQQVLMNLVINGRDAMPTGGRLTIATANVGLDERAGAPAASTKYVMVSVSDTGVGMDQETLAHIFEPFFTTKAQDRGTGFGLSIIYGIVKQSGGYVFVQSEPGKGSTFKIYLPRVEETPDNVIEIGGSTTVSLRSATILVAEDEPQIAELIRTVLENDGYSVLHAESGEEAMQLARSCDGEINILLSDLVLRGTMDGLTLAKQIALIRPGTRAVFMSGYSDAVTTATPAANARFLQKPFTIEELRRTLGEVLQGGERPLASPTFAARRASGARY